jgi:lauroyl/myristoyl acyltransferase
MRLQLFLGGLHQHGRPIPTKSVLVSGEAYYKQALDTGRPVVLLGLHAGLLELLHQIPATPPRRPFLILTAPAFSTALSKFMAQGRAKEGKEVIWMRSQRNKRPLIGWDLATGLRSVLKRSGVFALMVDQNPQPELERDILILWNGISVAYPARLLDFLSRSGCLFVPVSTFLQDDGCSHFTFHPTWDQTEVKTSSLGETTPNLPSLQVRIRNFLETSIAQAPEQWNWSYPKTKPHDFYR